MLMLVNINVSFDDALGIIGVVSYDGINHATITHNANDTPRNIRLIMPHT